MLSDADGFIMPFSARSQAIKTYQYSRVMERHRASQAFNLIHDKVTLPDVTIRLRKRQWQVHSDLLIAESGFFRAALRDDFKVSNSSIRARNGVDQARKPRLSR